jgi:lysozyme
MTQRTKDILLLIFTPFVLWALYITIRTIVRRIKFNINTFTPTQRIADAIKGWESCRLKTYPDIAGKRTIGWGHNLDSDSSMFPGADLDTLTITQQQADDLLNADINKAAQTVKDYTNVKLNQDTFDALTDFVYNLGPGAFINSPLLANINKGNTAAQIALEIQQYNHANGKVSDDLTRRRKWEASLINFI